MAKNIFFTPGPSALYYTVEEHIKSALRQQVAEISHRGNAYKSIHESAVNNLRALFGLPDDYHIAFVASATEIWERLIQNMVAEHALFLVNGAFSKRFYEVAGELGKKAVKLESQGGHIPDLSKLPDMNFELIGVAQNETSTGVAFPDGSIKILREKYPNAILALDVVSSAPVLPIDFSLVDSAYFSVQKCFGLPAGLGVWIYNDRCLLRVEQLISMGNIVGSYHALHRIHEAGIKFQTPETPNVLNIYLLAKVAEDMLTKGLDMIRRESNYKAALLYQLFEDHPLLAAFAATKEIRSKTVTVANVATGSSKLIQFLAEKKIMIGSGYGTTYKDQHIRIANFPTHSKEQMEMLVDFITQFEG